MVDIALPMSSAPGFLPHESSGRLINAYAEKLADGRSVRRRAPGLREVVDLASISANGRHARGFHPLSGRLLMAVDERLFAIDNSGGAWSAALLGPLPGTGPVTFGQNNNSPVPDVVAVTNVGVYNVTAYAAPTAFADGDLPAANSVSSLDGYLLFTCGDGRIFATDLNSLSVNSLSFTTAQARPGGLLRGVTSGQLFYAFGPASIEVYYDAGSQPFPLARQTVIQSGLMATHAVAGWEPGWANSLIYVAANGVVNRLDGYQPTTISNKSVERAIESLSNTDKAALEASVFMTGGHAFWALTSPGNWTWVYDATTEEWHERQSLGRTDWRASRAIRAFGRDLVGDRTTGKLWEVSASAYTEGADPLVFQADSLPSEIFPTRLFVSATELDFAAGVGNAATDPVQYVAGAPADAVLDASGFPITDETGAYVQDGSGLVGPILDPGPSALVSWSDDGSFSFRAPVTRSLGRQGDPNNIMRINRCGLTGIYGRVLRVTVADPVPVALIGASMDVEGRT